MESSSSWKFNKQDLLSWAHNLLVFLAPVVVIYGAFVQTNFQDGFSFSDFRPNQIVIGAAVLYLFNAAVDFFRKLIAGQ